MCKAIETTNIDIFVGGDLLASYSYLKREQIIDKDGYRIRATNATRVAEFISNLDIEIVFRTLSEEVSITCDILVFFVTKNITTNSRFCLLKLQSFIFSSIIGLNCLSIGPSITSFISIMESKDGVTVSTRLHEVIEPSVLSTLNCTATLECLNCSSLSKHDMILEQCKANVTLDGVKDGQYMLSLTIYCRCGEKIVLPPTLVTLGDG